MNGRLFAVHLPQRLDLRHGRRLRRDGGPRDPQLPEDGREGDLGGPCSYHRLFHFSIFIEWGDGTGQFHSCQSSFFPSLVKSHWK